ncbi:hypothetical protein CUC15_00520 [Oceanobacillus zhaokaii]|uniref:UVR domain-containing protein n=1 Tax=Oceanobacillus zhaokaii TaxID=2052660 RepID=A0A345PC39_9BACI|nr:UvrB/UvrC motif-containing protein [Oceanobacillus zhaokaii]AXI07569.1 hypothetical protein CUC15_00520 [Oceanobacillus zhaokaii]
MECQECQERPATLHFTQVINGKKKEIHVCEVCAKEKGYLTYPDETYSFHHLLTDLINFNASKIDSLENKTFKQQAQDLACAHCGMTFSQFKQIGKFGCASCYGTFSSRLDPIFRRAHAGNTKHNGKVPKRTGIDLQTRKQIESYKKELQHLIETEAFEDAAVIRDKIKGLESNSKKSEAGDKS